MKLDRRLAVATSLNRVSAILLARRYAAHSEAELVAVIAPLMQRIAQAETRLARKLTTAEMAHGLDKTLSFDSLPPSQREGARDSYLRLELQNSQRRKVELQTPTPPELSAEEKAVEAARRQVREERRAKMTSAELALANAEEALAAKRESDQRDAERQAFLSSPAVSRLLAVIDDAIIESRLNPDITGEQLLEFEHQRKLLMFHAVPSILPVVIANVEELQTAIRERLDADELRLKSALDALAASRKSLTTSPSVFDSVSETLVGDVVYVRLAKDGREVSISRERWESRESDESLAQMIFGGMA